MRHVCANQVLCLKESKKLLDYLAKEFGKDDGCRVRDSQTSFQLRFEREAAEVSQESLSRLLNSDLSEDSTAWQRLRQRCLEFFPLMATILVKVLPQTGAALSFCPKVIPSD